MKVIKYDLNESEIAKMASIYLELTIKDLDDKEGFDAVHAAKMIMVKHRTGIDKLRKETNADAQTFIKTNNTNAKKLLDQMEPIESHLVREEKKVTDEQKRIATEKKVAEELKTEKRVTALFAVDVNIPYFDAAMLDNAGFEAMLSEATGIYQDKQLEIEEEKKVKAAEEKRLADEKAAQEAEATRLAEIQATQEAKERELKEQQEAIENEKQKAQEAEDREAFKRQAVEDARIQAVKNAEKERIEQIAKVEETRLRSLQSVGFVYQAKDLGAMQDKKFFALHEKHKKAWDKKQKEIFAEKIEQDRLKAEKATAAEKARVEALLPDKEKLVKYAASILKLSAPDIKNKKAQQIMDKAQDGLSVIVNDIMQQVEEL